MPNYYDILVLVLYYCKTDDPWLCLERGGIMKLGGATPAFLYEAGVALGFERESKIPPWRETVVGGACETHTQY